MGLFDFLSSQPDDDGAEGQDTPSLLDPSTWWGQGGTASESEVGASDGDLFGPFWGGPDDDSGASGTGVEPTFDLLDSFSWFDGSASDDLGTSSPTGQGGFDFLDPTSWFGGQASGPEATGPTDQGGGDFFDPTSWFGGAASGPEVSGPTDDGGFDFFDPATWFGGQASSPEATGPTDEGGFDFLDPTSWFGGQTSGSEASGPTDQGGIDFFDPTTWFGGQTSEPEDEAPDDEGGFDLFDPTTWFGDQTSESEDETSDEEGGFDLFDPTTWFGGQTSEPEEDKAESEEEEGSWWDGIGDGAEAAWDWLTAGASQAWVWLQGQADTLREDVRRLQSEYGLSESESREIARIRAQYGLDLEGAIARYEELKRALSRYPFLKTTAQAERYLELVDAKLAQGAKRHEAEQAAYREMFPEEAARETRTFAKPGHAGTRTVAEPPPKKDEKDDEDEDEDGEPGLWVARKNREGLELIGSDQYTLLKCPPPEGEYARRGISPAELASTKAYLEDMRVTIAQRIDQAIERLDGPRLLMNAIHPVLNEMFEWLPAMGLEWQQANERRFRRMKLNLVPRIEVVAAPRPVFGVRATTSEQEEEEYFRALDAEYTHYSRIYSQLYDQVARYRYYAVSARKKLADRLKQEAPRAERLARRIGDLGQRQTISQIRNEVCCIYAVVRYLELMIDMAEGVETSIVNVEAMRESRDRSYLAVDLIPINFERVGLDIASWFGTDENVRRLSAALVDKFLAHKAPSSVDDCTALDLHSDAGVFERLKEFERDIQLERADIDAANKRYHDAVRIAEIGANIIAEATVFIATMGVGNVARASMRGVRAIGRALVAGVRGSARATLRSVSSALVALRAAKAKVGSFLRFSYKKLWQARRTLLRQVDELPDLARRVRLQNYEAWWNELRRQTWNMHGRGPTYKEVLEGLRVAFPEHVVDSHHLLQKVILKRLGISSRSGPAIALEGPVTTLGTQHYLATTAQRAGRAASHTWSGELARIESELLEAGLSETTARAAVDDVTEFLGRHGLDLDSVVPLDVRPRNTRGVGNELVGLLFLVLAEETTE